MPQAANYDIDFYDGAKFEETWTWLDRFGNPVDLSSFGARMSAVDEPGGKKLFEISSANGDITLNSSGQIAVTVPKSKTSNYSVKRSYWQLEVFPDTANDETDVERILQGEIKHHKRRD